MYVKNTGLIPVGLDALVKCLDIPAYKSLHPKHFLASDFDWLGNYNSHFHNPLITSKLQDLFGITSHNTDNSIKQLLINEMVTQATNRRLLYQKIDLSGKVHFSIRGIIETRRYCQAEGVKNTRQISALWKRCLNQHFTTVKV